MTPRGAYGKAFQFGKRLPEFEELISTDPFASFLYATNVIKDRWIEAEDVIMKSAYCSSRYAKTVIKGKLPEKMHNMMILHAIEDSNNYSIKQYFEYISK